MAVLGEDLSRVVVTPEAQEFAQRQGLGEALLAAIRIVHKHFAVIDPVTVSLESDPEVSNSSSLVIQAPVAGDPPDVSRSHWQFSIEAASLLGPQREKINLICDLR